MTSNTKNNDQQKKKSGNPRKVVYVTEPSLPPLSEFIPYLEEIWSSKRVTNNGHFHQQLETALAEYLGVEYVSLFSNGTLALISALQALNIRGEVITTPYSFVASTHALHWNGIKPVFADIDPVTMNLDPQKIEAAITPNTTAIMPVHIYGNPCDVERINYLSDIYGLKVVYDAAHAFGVEINGQSVLNYGDLSILSFHGTKVFTTFEGGAIISHDKAMKKRIDFLKNFGFADEVTVVGPGINGKMSEFQGALGLLQLKYVDKAIENRKHVTELYRNELTSVKGIRFLDDLEGVKHSYPYFPILIDEEIYGASRDRVHDELRKNNIIARRYFYPLISQFPTYNELETAKPGNLPVAEKITNQILCLPIYPGLDRSSIKRILNIIRKS
ncbi:MAG: DegT/DnrJ/EryC1/StrS family aminotransferase [Bacteroidota bacterium]|nr:DegT/DnrJ/EryC1/StrS family aminotransferase [Bacteroidota bacterium]